MEEVSI